MSESTAAARPVVVGVDGSGASLRALEWAVEEAQLRRAPLRVVHAITRPVYDVPVGPAPLAPVGEEARKQAQLLLEDAHARVSGLAPEVGVETQSAVGFPAAVMLSQSRDACLVAVGARGLGGVGAIVVGSVGVELAARAACPVAVLPDNAIDDQPGERGVVVGVDGSLPGEHALAFAFEEARARGVGVIAVHAWSRPVLPETILVPTAPITVNLASFGMAARELLEQTLAPLRERFPDVKVTARAVQGHAGGSLIDAAGGADLLVVGSRGFGGFTGLLLGSVGQAVLHHAPCPVVVVRPN
ncbi:MAG: universal stress protein [Streptosporangiales bacterium]|nr:universal stress protein [Streptosporangiales bacterium]